MNDEDAKPIHLILAGIIVVLILFIVGVQVAYELA